MAMSTVCVYWLELMSNAVISLKNVYAVPTTTVHSIMSVAALDGRQSCFSVQYLLYRDADARLFNSCVVSNGISLASVSCALEVCWYSYYYSCDKACKMIHSSNLVVYIWMKKLYNFLVSV